MTKSDKCPESANGISAVICAYNEASRIEAVLRVVVDHPLIDEVIVVDDGSTDGTAEVIARYPSIKLIQQSENRGKSAAMAVGVAAAGQPLLMLLDADLIGLDADGVTALAMPVLSGHAQVSLSLRRNSLLIFRAIGLDFVTGERVIKKALLTEALPAIDRLPRFGIEVFMNQCIIAKRLPVAVVRWPMVTQTRKTEKLGYWKGQRAEIRMLTDLFSVRYPLALLSQSIRLLSLRVEPRIYAKGSPRLLPM